MRIGLTKIKHRGAPEYRETQASANRKLEALQPERRNRYVNGVANSIKAMTEAIMRKNALRRNWNNTLRMKVKAPYLSLAFALCASGQTGVTERSARRLFIAMSSLVMAMQDRGLAKGANAGQGWGYPIVMSEIFRKIFKFRKSRLSSGGTLSGFEYLC